MSMICPQTKLPMGEPQEAIPVPHFPTLHQAVIWRNWSLVTAERLARVLETDLATLRNAALELGLGAPATPAMEHLWLKRGYITLIRQNWHLLPYTQLLTLLDWTAEQLAFALKEDDFLWHKLGNFKPALPPVIPVPLTPDEAAQTAAIRAMMETVKAAPTSTRPFEFLRELSDMPKSWTPADRHGDLKMVYSYFAVYGDPLLDPELDPYPDGLLARLATLGVNGVWLQGTLYTLVPWLGDSPYSRGHEQRLVNLRSLVARAARFGIGVYLYLNEPRAMPGDFYASHPEWRGTSQPSSDSASPCLSQPEVLEALGNGVAELARQVPELGGVFTITASENLTHCKSHFGRTNQEMCPRCADRPPAELIALANNAIAEGLHRVTPAIRVLAWNWAWEPEWANDVTAALRPDITLMCTSETYLPTRAVGIEGLVADYSISKPGPGPLAVDQWTYAGKRHLPCVAKVQLNNTWECSAVPYLPVPYLAREHLDNLANLGISQLMAGWTLGGYPGGNLALTEQPLDVLAESWFGEAAAPGVLAAWRAFGEAFREFPFHGCGTLYTGPQNYGPMNHLHLKPTGHKATMIGFPYDDLLSWRCNGHFPEEVFDEQFRKLSEGWGHGLKILAEAATQVTAAHQAAMDDLMSVAQATYCHFRSSWLQIRFIRLRETGSPAELAAILAEEESLVRRLLELIRQDSRLGYESTNHYFYTEATLLEKLLNLQYIREARQLGPFIRP